MTPAIRVLIVEDSATVQLVLSRAIEADPGLRVIGMVNSGERALEFLRFRRPDVILMDIHLPGISGFETTRRIMQTNPTPIVICSSTADLSDVGTTFQAISAGALAVLPKPAGLVHNGEDATGRQLAQTLRLMSEVKLVRRWSNGRAPRLPPVLPPDPPASGTARMVAIGTSTGGPPVLNEILSRLPPELPVPVLVVQHIAPGFLPGLVDWLGRNSALPLHIATAGEHPLPGHAYFAPDSAHMGIGSRGEIALAPRATDDVVCPSVSHLFRTIAAVYRGNVVAVLLTGMGRDGASELAVLRSLGATTLVQDKATSVVHGMPGEAIKLDAATHVLAASEIAPMITRLFSKP